VFAEVPRVGGHLRRITPRVVADDHQRAALRMRAREISQRQRVGGDVEADRFHRAHGAERAHLGPIEHGGAEGFVVGNASADALFLV
jgi:hypothetical protein